MGESLVDGDDRPGHRQQGGDKQDQQGGQAGGEGVLVIPNNGVSYRFYNERDILTTSDYVFQAEAYRS